MPRLDPPLEHRFKKGRSGNPTGKKGPRLTERLRYQVEQLIQTQDGSQLTYADAMVKIVLDMALKRDLDAIKFIFDRIEGKVLDRVRMEEADGGNRTVTYQIEYVNDWRLEAPAPAIERDGRIAPSLPDAPETDRDGPGAARDEGSVRSDVPAPEPGPAAPAPPPERRDPKGPEWIS